MVRTRQTEVLKVQHIRPKKQASDYEVPKSIYEPPKHPSNLYKPPKKSVSPYKPPDKLYEAPSGGYNAPKSDYKAPSSEKYPKELYQLPEKYYLPPKKVSRKPYEPPKQLSLAASSQHARDVRGSRALCAVVCPCIEDGDSLRPSEKYQSPARIC